MSDAGDQYIEDIAAKITDVKASLTTGKQSSITTEATAAPSDSEWEVTNKSGQVQKRLYYPRKKS